MTGYRPRLLQAQRLMAPARLPGCLAGKLSPLANLSHTGPPKNWLFGQPASGWYHIDLARGRMLVPLATPRAYQSARTLIDITIRWCAEIPRPNTCVQPRDQRIDVVDRHAQRLPQRMRVGWHIRAFQHDSADVRMPPHQRPARVKDVA